MGAAQSWAAQQLREDGSLHLPAEAIYKLFQEDHRGIDDELKAEAEIATFKQTSSVEAYTKVFTLLIARLLQLSEYDKCVRYMTGLKALILREIQKLSPATLNDAKCLAGIQDRDYTNAAAMRNAWSPNDMDIDIVHQPFVMYPGYPVPQYTQAAPKNPTVIRINEMNAQDNTRMFLFWVSMNGIPLTALFNSGCTGMIISNNIA
ncbi:hypothetical protein LPJ61_003673 [Coemansia biformis]|uniref:Retrotransposon gag domain-containing protein n=1 Tax=Coemansia biformis TaxID=1286918 RepID=A0A9W7YA37_9FUNG|nr:hypothetical protein LPJ61_003673 [Coemansia biformis]